MTDTVDHVIDLIFGRWRSQTLYAGVELGVFEVVGEYPTHADEIADQLDIDRDLGYRLLRALSSLGVLDETADRRFSITPAGELLQEDHPESLRGVTLLEESPTLNALWTHLPDLVREDEQNAFDREFGFSGSVEYRETNPEYAQVFNDAMTSYSKMQSAWTLEMFDGDDFSDVSHVCDVGGGRGHLLCSLLKEYPYLEGTVLELPIVVKDDDGLLAPQMGVADRCTYVAGDMFEAVPEADMYLMKYILHDYNDEECKEVLSTIRESAPRTHAYSLWSRSSPTQRHPILRSYSTSICWWQRPVGNEPPRSMQTSSQMPAGSTLRRTIQRMNSWGQSKLYPTERRYVTMTPTRQTRRTVLKLTGAGLLGGVATLGAASGSEESFDVQRKSVTNATAKYQDVREALDDGYEIMGPYVPDMGFHLVNFKRIKRLRLISRQQRITS